jgi:hypothetical protein
MTKQEVSKAIGTIGYDIIDNIIAPVAGIKYVIADLYLANVETYVHDKNEIDSVYRAIEKKYCLITHTLDHVEGCPIALIALLILEEGSYLDD